MPDEETDDPLYADRRNFYKVEKWSRDGLSGGKLKGKEPDVRLWHKADMELSPGNVRFWG